MTQVSSHKWVMIIIGSCFSTLIIWAYFAEIDQVIRAPGTIEPLGDVHRIQNRFPGEISSVNVRLGQLVNKDEVLFVLKPEENEQATDKLEDRLYRTQARADRLSQQIEFPTDATQIRFTESIPSYIRNAEKAALSTEQADLELKLASVKSKRSEVEIQLQEATIQEAHFQELAKISTQERKIIEPLVQDGLEPKLRLTQIAREIATNAYQAREAKLAQVRAKQQLEALELQVKQLRTEYLIRTQSDLRESLSELNEIQNDFEAASERLSQTRIKAPIRGIVSKVADVTPGSVYPGGDLLAELVPLSEGFIANIRVPPKERPNIQLQQEVRISFDAYDFATHGHVFGQITQIADNTTKTETESFYEAVVELPMLITTKSKKRIQATPGMNIQAEILGEPKTVLDYVLNPLVKTQSAALTEQ